MNFVANSIYASCLFILSLAIVPDITAQDTTSTWIVGNSGFDFAGFVRSQSISNQLGPGIYFEPEPYIAPPVVFGLCLERHTKKNRRIGIGINYKYGNSGALKFVTSNIGPSFDPAASSVLVPLHFNVTEQKLTVWLYQNLKMPLNHSRTQVYFPLMVGVTMISEEIVNGYLSDDKNYHENYLFSAYPNFRFAIGFQYLLTKNFVFRIEPIGIGGPLVSAGFAYQL